MLPGAWISYTTGLLYLGMHLWLLMGVAVLTTPTISMKLGCNHYNYGYVPAQSWIWGVTILTMAMYS